MKFLITSFFCLFFFLSNGFALSPQVPMLTATTGLAGMIELTWAPVTEALSYQIQKSFNGTDFFTIAMVSPESNRYSDSGLFYQVQYWYRIVTQKHVGSEVSNIALATTEAALPQPYPLYQDGFNAHNVNPAWKFLGGTWTQSNGMLMQIDAQKRAEIKAAVLINQVYPQDQTITAKVKVTSWAEGDSARAGVAIYVDPDTGVGDELVFHGSNHVQFLGNTAWGQRFDFPWEIGEWYWFKLSYQNDRLLGKIWADGSVEPSSWQFQQPWTTTPQGSPALIGGGAGDGFATAVFDAVNITGTASPQKPFVIHSRGDIDPAKLRITTFAKGLNYPHGMRELTDGSLLVATSDPKVGGAYSNSIGTLRRFVDADHDGIADGPGQVVYTGLPGMLTALEVIDDLVFVTSSQTNQEFITFIRMEGGPGGHYSGIGAIRFFFPVAYWDHRTYALAVRRTPGTTGEYDLFFNVGSEFNDAKDEHRVTISGLITGTLNGSSIYMVHVKKTTTGLALSNLTQVASGLRNASGLSFDTLSGDLYIAENGKDMPFNPNEPISVDTVHKIPGAMVGQKIFDFGFPDSYITYRSGVVMGPPTLKPLVAFQPIPDAYTGSESEGPSEIAIAPKSFPGGLNNGFFVGFHGRFLQGGLANEENPVLYYDLSTRQYHEFISNKEPGIGHIDGLLATRNALYLADLSNNGDLLNAPGMGMIYKIEKLAS